jgi:acylphosphatase
VFKEIPKPEVTPDEITTLNIRVEGVVQGVGFRAFVLREAKALKLTGWVRNRKDGTVEALASGTTVRVEELVQAIMQRPPAGSHIAHIDLNAAELPNKPGFIMRTSL